MLMPHALALLAIVEAMAAVMHQHVQYDVFRHAHGEIGIDDAHDRHVGQLRIGEDVIDAGAERKDRLETRQAREQPARRVPGAGIGDVGGIAEALRPQADVAPRRQRAHALPPRLRIEPSDGEEDRGHQCIFQLASILPQRTRAPSPARKSGLPDLRKHDAHPGQARDAWEKVVGPRRRPQLATVSRAGAAAVMRSA